MESVKFDSSRLSSDELCDLYELKTSVLYLADDNFHYRPANFDPLYNIFVCDSEFENIDNISKVYNLALMIENTDELCPNRNELIDNLKDYLKCNNELLRFSDISTVINKIFTIT